MTENATNRSTKKKRLWIIIGILCLLLLAVLWEMGGADLPGEEHMRLGDAAYAEGNFHTARSHYINAIITFQRDRDWKNFSEACIATGRADLVLGDGIHAKEFLEDAVLKADALNDSLMAVESRFLMGKTELLLGNLEAARGFFEYARDKGAGAGREDLAQEAQRFLEQL